MKTETEDRLDVLEIMFDSYWRGRFVSVLSERLSLYGIRFSCSGEDMGSVGENPTYVILNSIARTIAETLEADGAIVALFTEPDGGSCIFGRDGQMIDADRPQLFEAIKKLARHSRGKISGAYVEIDGILPATDGAVSNLPEAAIVAPIVTEDRECGIVAASKDGSKGFVPTDLARLQLATVILGGVIHEVITETRNEERLRSLAQGLTAALDARDPRTRGHSDRVAMYAMAILNELKNGETDTEYQILRSQIRLASVMHDIGKIGIPDSILLKPEGLTEDEWACIRQHPILGAEIITACHGFKDLVPGVLYHHEHFDGSGYPFFLKGDEIPLAARIIAVADAFDAITSDRPHKKGRSHHEAIGILTDSAKEFDPAVLEALIHSHEKGTLKYVRVPAKSARIGSVSDGEIEDVYGKHFKSIPSLPALLATVSSLLDDPQAPLRQAAQLLSADEGLASRVLRLVNSAYYGLPRTISTIPLATTILGSRAIKNHVINIAFADIMGSFGGAYREYELLWRHALKTASWARGIAERLHKADPEEAFTAGLIHDIGKAVSLRLKPGAYGKIILEAGKSGKPLMGIEEQIVGFDHTRIGAWVTSRWGLPSTLVHSIRWHHDPDHLSDETPDVYRLVVVVHLGDIVARAFEKLIPVSARNLLGEVSSKTAKEIGHDFFDKIMAMKDAVKIKEETLAAVFDRIPMSV